MDQRKWGRQCFWISGRHVTKELNLLSPAINRLEMSPPLQNSGEGVPYACAWEPGFWEISTDQPERRESYLQKRTQGQATNWKSKLGPGLPPTSPLYCSDPHSSKCGPGASSRGSPGRLLDKQGSTSELMNQNLHVNKVPWDTDAH